MTTLVQPILLIFFGAPGSGKSTCLQYLKDSSFNFEIITKETTRERRKDDASEIKSVRKISQNLDIRYTQYDIEYGASSKKIWECFKKGKNAAIIINDIRTIRLLKDRFGVLARCIYIHSNITKAKLKELITKKRTIDRNNEEAILEETEKRLEKINTIHRKYIDNTGLFDYAILNIASFADLHTQLKNIVIHAKSNLRRSVKSSVKIFLIVGATYSGKDELVMAMQLMEKGRILNYKKATTREVRPKDKGELRHLEKIPKEFSILYEKNNHKYAISPDELWDGLSKGNIYLLVVSDQESIEMLISIFGDICTTLFLHANLNEEEMREMLVEEGVNDEEIEKRINVVQELFNLYVKKTELFNHVLLNTAAKEDLYDQAFNIIDHYS